MISQLASCFSPSSLATFYGMAQLITDHTATRAACASSPLIGNCTSLLILALFDVASEMSLQIL